MQIDDATNADVMLGMPDFRVIKAMRGPVTDRLEVVVETIAPRRGCPDCAVVGVVKERCRVSLADVTMGGAPSRLVWAKRRFSCVEPSCVRGSWVEQHDDVGVRSRTTRQLRVRLTRAVAAGRSVAEAAIEVGVSWATAWRAVGVLAAAEGEPLWLVERLGVDETRSNGRHTAFTTHLVDLDRGIVIRSIPGRNKAVLVAALEAMPAWWRAGVRVVAIDAYAPFAAALREALQDAVPVVDKFHIVRLLAHALDQVRRRTSQGVNGRRGRKVDQLWTGRRVLLRRGDRLNKRGRERLQAMVEAEDPHGHVEAAYAAYQGLFDLLDRAGTTGLRSAINRFLELLDPRVPELATVGRTVDKWMAQLWAIFTTGGVTNAATEGVNRKIKAVKRVGYGFRNEINYLTRVRLHCGHSAYRQRHQEPATPRSKT